MRWCGLQTNEHDLQAIMYQIVCKYHRLNIKNGNKVPVFPGYICNRWQNMIVQPSQTHNLQIVFTWFLFFRLCSRFLKHIACRRCSNYIFILNLTRGFNGLGKDNYKTGRETVMFRDWVRLILENWRYLSLQWPSSVRHIRLPRPQWTK